MSIKDDLKKSMKYNQHKVYQFFLQEDSQRDIVSLLLGIKHLQKISKSLVKFISALNILLNQSQKTSVKFYQAYILPIKSVLKKLKYQASSLGKPYEDIYRRFNTDLSKQSEG